MYSGFIAMPSAVGRMSVSASFLISFCTMAAHLGGSEESRRVAPRGVEMALRMICRLHLMSAEIFCRCEA